MLEYHFSKGFGIFEFNTNNLAKLSNATEQRIHSEEIDNSDYIMTYINTIPSILKKPKKFLLHNSLHSSYVQIEFND